MIKAIILKEFTSGFTKGISFNDQVTIKTVSQLDVMDLIGKNIESIGCNYKIINISLYDTELGDYISKKQAEFKLK